MSEKSHCYKCGCELESGVECEPFCTYDAHAQAAADRFNKMMDRAERQSVGIDWDKVKTFDDMKEIAVAFLGDMKVMRGSVVYRRLKKFLKE